MALDLHIQTLVDYHYWANERLLAAAEALSPEQYDRDLGSSFPSVRATVAHMLNAEAIWLSRFLGVELERVAPADLPDLRGVRERWARLEEQVRQLVASPDLLTRELTVTTSTGQVYRHQLWEAIVHLCNHGTYHRGQLTTMLRQLGAAPAGTDLIVYYREKR